MGAEYDHDKTSRPGKLLQEKNHAVEGIRNLKFQGLPVVQHTTVFLFLYWTFDGFLCGYHSLQHLSRAEFGCAQMLSHYCDCRQHPEPTPDPLKRFE